MPTELILAFRAHYMKTASIFLNQDPTVWAGFSNHDDSYKIAHFLEIRHDLILKVVFEWPGLSLKRISPLVGAFATSKWLCALYAIRSLADLNDAHVVTVRVGARPDICRCDQQILTHQVLYLIELYQKLLAY